MQFPTVGRIVHYQSYGTPNGEFKPLPRAAIITEITDAFSSETHQALGTYPLIGICVLNPTGMFFNQNVPYSMEPKPGHWSWPPRV